MARLLSQRLGELLIEAGIMTEEQLKKVLEEQKDKKVLLGEILIERGYASVEQISATLGKQYRLISKTLGTLLIEQQVITMQQLEEALQIQSEKGGLLGQILVGLNYITEEEVVKCLTTQFGFPYLPLINYEIDPEIIGLVPQEVAREYYVIPVDKISKMLIVTMADPLNQMVLNWLKQHTGLTVETFVSPGKEIIQTIEKYYGASAVSDDTKPEERVSRIDFFEAIKKGEKSKKKDK